MTSGARVLVTGARGSVGRQVARALVAAGDEVYGFSRAKLDDEGIRWLRGDLLKPEDVLSAVRQSSPSHVLHAAGLPGPAELKPLVEANVAALASVIDALADTRIERLVVIGSAAEYAAIDSTDPIDEGHQLAPSNNYGLSKLFQFELSQLAVRRGMPVVYARPFNVVGPGAPPATAVGDISRRLALLVREGGSEILEVGDLDKWRDYIDVRDVASACVTLLREGAPGGVYNICSGVGVQLSDVVERLIAITGKPIELRRTDRGRSIGFQVGDPSRMKSLGWSPRFELDASLRDGLASALIEVEASRRPSSSR